MKPNDFPYEQPQSDFESADDVMAELESIPGIQQRVADLKPGYEAMERDHRIGLANLRTALALTQTEVAEKMGVKQTTLSRIEARPDILVSTLRSYLRAIGAEANLRIRIGDTTVEANLDQLLPA